MKFPTKYTDTQYEIGSTRIKRVFAWWPKYIDGFYVWLEHYEILEGYTGSSHIVNVEGGTKAFTITQWVELSTRIFKK